MTETRISRLSNGIPLVTESLPGISSVAIRAYVRAGSRYESADVGGVAHILEHMAFKGTTTRSARDLALSVERVGANINAMTGVEKTSYDVHALGEHAQLGIDILADVITNSTIPDNELENERGVIVQEIRASLDDPEDLVNQIFNETAFPDQAIGRETLGKPEFVMTVEREQIVDFMRQHYGANTITLVAAGNVDHDSLHEISERAFGGLPAVASAAVAPARYIGGYECRKGTSEQMHIKLGLPVCSIRSPDYPATDLLSDVLGGGMSSPLSQEVREKRGLAYDIMATSRHYSDAGTFQIYAALAEENLPEFFNIACDELLKICERIEPEDFERAKNQHRAYMLMQRESPLAVAGALGRDMLNHGRAVPIDETLAAYAAVTMRDIQRVARNMLRMKPTLAIVGPFDDLDDIDDDFYSQVCTRLAGIA